MAVKDKKTEQIHIRISKNDKKRLEKKADKNNMTVSEYLIKVGLGGFIDEDKINGAKALVAYREFMEVIIQKVGHKDLIIEEGDKIWDTIVMK